MIYLQTANQAGCSTPKARIRNYFTAAFPEAKTIKVRDYFRNHYKVRLRFYIDGQMKTVYGNIPSDDWRDCLNLRLNLIEKMEIYC